MLSLLLFVSTAASSNGIRAVATGPPPMPAGCYVDDANGPVSFKFASGDLFPSTPHHGFKLADSPAHCCAVCNTRSPSATRVAILKRAASINSSSDRIFINKNKHEYCGICKLGTNCYFRVKAAHSLPFSLKAP